MNEYEDNFAEGYYSYPEMLNTTAPAGWMEGYWTAHNELAEVNGVEVLLPE